MADLICVQGEDQQAPPNRTQERLKDEVEDSWRTSTLPLKKDQEGDREQAGSNQWDTQGRLCHDDED